MATIEPHLQVYLSHDHNINPSTKFDSKQFVISFISSFEGMQMLMGRFFLFEDENVRKFVLTSLDYWIRHRFADLNDSMKDCIDAFLFNECMERLQTLGKELYFPLCVCQSNLLMKRWTQGSSMVISDLIARENRFAYNFIIAFSAELVTPEFYTFGNAIRIISELIEMKIDSNMISISLRGMNMLNPLAFNALAGVTRWGDLSWLSKPDSMQSVLAGLDEDTTLPSTINIFCSLMVRDMPTSYRHELFLGLDILDVAREALEAQDQCDSHLMIASLINLCGMSFVNFDIGIELFEVALSILTTKGDHIASKVVSFISNYILLHPDSAVQALAGAISRTAMYFESSPLQISQFAEQLSFIAYTAYTADINSCSELVGDDSIAVTTSQYEYEIAAILFVLYDSAKLGCPDPGLVERLETYSFLLESDVTEATFPAVLGYLRLPLAMKENDISPEIIEAIFTRALQLVVSNDIDQEMQTKLFRLMPHLSMKLGGKLPKSLVNEGISAMLSKGFPDLAVAAAYLCNLPGVGSKKDFIEAAVQSGLECALAFLRSFEVDEESADYVEELLRSAAAQFESDEESYAHVIRAVPCLGERGKSLLMSLLTGKEGYYHVLGAASNALMMLKIRNHEEEIIIASGLRSLVEDMKASCVSAEDAAPFFQICASCIRYLAGCSLCASDIVLQTAEDLLTRWIEIPDLVIVVCRLLMSAAERRGETVAQGFTALTMMVYLSPGLETNTARWTQAIRSVVEFHLRLKTRAFEVFSNECALATSRLGGVEGMSQVYIDALSRELSIRTVRVSVFASELRQAFQSLKARAP